MIFIEQIFARKLLINITHTVRYPKGAFKMLPNNTHNSDGKIVC